MAITKDAMQPRIGMLATVRNRRGVVTAVEPHDGGPDGRLHLVTLEYVDGDGAADDTIVWEREVAPHYPLRGTAACLMLGMLRTAHLLTVRAGSGPARGFVGRTQATR